MTPRDDQVRVVTQAALPIDGFARELVGAAHGGLPASLLLIDAAPGEGPARHMHRYHEVLVVLAGDARYDDGERQLFAGPGDIVIVPPGRPHDFVNVGAGRLRQLDIHLHETFQTTWLA